MYCWHIYQQKHEILNVWMFDNWNYWRLEMSYVKWPIQHTVEQDNMLIITISDSKNGIRLVPTIKKELCKGVNSLELYRKYSAVRPGQCNHNSFCINYKLEKCWVSIQMWTLKFSCCCLLVRYLPWVIKHILP